MSNSSTSPELQDQEPAYCCLIRMTDSRICLPWRLLVPTRKYELLDAVLPLLSLATPTRANSFIVDPPFQNTMSALPLMPVFL